MPIYEFRCLECGVKSSFLLLSVNSTFEPKCQACGSPRVVRLVSRVAVLRSEESRLESLADASKLGELNENDPKSLARWMKKIGKEMGEELGPEFNEEIDRAIEESEKDRNTEENVEKNRNLFKRESSDLAYDSLSDSGDDGGDGGTGII